MELGTAIISVDWFLRFVKQRLSGDLRLRSLCGGIRVLLLHIAFLTEAERAQIHEYTFSLSFAAIGAV